MPVIAVLWLALRRLPTPVFVLTTIGWVLMTGGNVLPVMPDLCLSTGNFGRLFAARTEASLTTGNVALIVVSWFVMMIAMMTPLVSAPLQHVWRQSLGRRRWRASCMFLSAYALGWIAAGGFLIPSAMLLQSGIGASQGGPLLLAICIALVWQATPWKQLALNRCHQRSSLAAFGAAAELDDLRFGFKMAFWCIGTCWAFMLCVLLTSGMLQWAAMAAVMSISVLERTHAARAPAWGFSISRQS